MLAQLTQFARGGSDTAVNSPAAVGTPPATSNSASSLLRSLASAAVSNADKQRKKSPRKVHSEMGTATSADISLISPITAPATNHSGTVSPRSVSPRSRSSSISETPFPPFTEASLIISLRELKGLTTNEASTDFVIITKLSGHKFRSKQYNLQPSVEFREETYPFKVKDPTVPLKISIYKVDEKGERTKRLGKCIPTLADNAMRLVKVTSDCWWSVNQQFQNQKSLAYLRIVLDYDSERKHRDNHALRKKAASTAVLPAHKPAHPKSKNTRSINSLNDQDNKQKRLVKEKSAKDMMQLFHSFKLEQATILKTWAINQQELIFEEEVAEGVSAKVFKGKYRDQAVAIKVLKETLGPKEQADFEKEFELLMNLRSLHIVFFYGICFKPQTCIVLEWCEHGSLYDFMKAKPEIIDWSMGLRYMTEIVRAINTLHTWKPPIVHRDLKSQNVLVADNGSLKICDLGLARSALPSTDNMATLGKVRGTFQYTAPELYSKQQYTAKADMYSTGVIFWEIATRVITGEYHQPFSEYKHLKFDFQIYLQVVKQNLRPTIPPTCPPALQALIERCWDFDPDKRPTTTEVLAVIQHLKEDYQKNRLIWDAAILPLPLDPVELEGLEAVEQDDGSQPPSASSSSSSVGGGGDLGGNPLTASAPV